jgi:hypothetical protein
MPKFVIVRIDKRVTLLLGLKANMSIGNCNDEDVRSI